MSEVMREENMQKLGNFITSLKRQKEFYFLH